MNAMNELLFLLLFSSTLAVGDQGPSIDPDGLFIANGVLVSDGVLIADGGPIMDPNGRPTARLSLARGDEGVHGMDAHGSHGVDLLTHLHRPDLGGEG